MSATGPSPLKARAKLFRKWLFLWGVFLSASFSQARVTLPAIFSDHMVLQREMKNPIWGTADPNEHVVVALDSHEVQTDASSDGHWKADLPAMDAGGPHVISIRGKNTVTISDVLIGEVWLCAGQSNMEFGVGAVLNHPQEVAQANFPKIRLCIVPHTVADNPATDVPVTWAACSPETVPKFSGVGYYFGRDLQADLNVPVGLIQDTWSGTNIDGWMSRRSLRTDPDFQPLQDRWATKIAGYPKAKADYDRSLPELTKTWQASAAKAKASGKPIPDQPRPPDGPGSRYTPSGIFNGQIAPLAQFSIRGIAWYQGENNTWQAFIYRKQLVAMINDWRDLWGQAALPFVVIQLPSVIPSPPVNSDWAELRESQSAALTLPNTALVNTIDLGDPEHPENLHPRNKKDVGDRLSLVARKLVYHEQIVASGPTETSVVVAGDRIRVTFDNADGLKAKDSGPVIGFELADAAGKYVAAIGSIEGDTVSVHSDGMPHPLTVRYDWANNPKGNLYNGAGLPTYPFRTDSFPLRTQNSK